MKIDRFDEKEMLQRRKKRLKDAIKFTPLTCKHFKGDFYEVIGIAIHTETREELVFYRRKYVEPFSIWARPIDMFLSFLEEKYEDMYPDTLYRMTLYDELTSTQEQRDLAYDMKLKIVEDGLKFYAQTLRGEIVRVASVFESGDEYYVAVVRGSHILTPTKSPKELIPASEFFTDNFKIMKEGELTVDGLVQASQLLEQIHGSTGRF